MYGMGLSKRTANFFGTIGRKSVIVLKHEDKLLNAITDDEYLLAFFETNKIFLSSKTAVYNLTNFSKLKNDRSV